MTAFVLKAYTLVRSAYAFLCFFLSLNILLCVYTILRFYQTREYNILFHTVNTLLTSEIMFIVEYIYDSRPSNEVARR